jgi:sulfate adenylyltransferase subunit 1
LSALDGDNVITSSTRTPWFDGTSLLEHLETVQVDRTRGGPDFRFPVQLVLRPDHEFRGYAGQIVAGTVRPGDAVTSWPSGLTTRVGRIVTWDGDLDVASAPMSVTLVLDDELDISRGDVLAAGTPLVSRRFTANVVWMDERPLDPARLYLLKHNTRTVTAEVDQPLSLNEIGVATISASQPLVFDPYSEDRSTGSFVLIDPATNFTAGAGMIIRAVREHTTSTASAAAARLAHAARSAATEADAIEAVRRALEEVLT